MRKLQKESFKIWLLTLKLKRNFHKFIFYSKRLSYIGRTVWGRIMPCLGEACHKCLLRLQWIAFICVRCVIVTFVISAPVSTLTQCPKVFSNHIVSECSFSRMLHSNLACVFHPLYSRLKKPDYYRN